MFTLGAFTLIVAIAIFTYMVLDKIQKHFKLSPIQTLLIGVAIYFGVHIFIAFLLTPLGLPILIVAGIVYYFARQAHHRKGLSR
jgi:hypothetical protein